jgi:hypothetical protein
MDKYEKVIFIQNFMSAVQGELLSKIKDVPEAWDGIELRWWIADTFKTEQVDWNDKGRYRARKKRYNNDIAISDL